MKNSETDSGSRQRMLESTIVLMRQRGLSGAGINEIVRHSGAPKGSVYHFFPAGKQQIVGEALAVYGGRVAAFIEQALASKTHPPDKLRALFTAFARRVEEGDFAASCAAGTVSLDLDNDLENLRQVLAVTFADWQKQIAGQLALADPVEGASFAGLVLTAIEGAYIRCRAERSSRPFSEAGEWLARLLEGST